MGSLPHLWESLGLFGHSLKTIPINKPQWVLLSTGLCLQIWCCALFSSFSWCYLLANLKDIWTCQSLLHLHGQPSLSSLSHTPSFVSLLLVSLTSSICKHRNRPTVLLKLFCNNLLPKSPQTYPITTTFFQTSLCYTLTFYNLSITHYSLSHLQPYAGYPWPWPLPVQLPSCLLSPGDSYCLSSYITSLESRGIEVLFCASHGTLRFLCQGNTVTTVLKTALSSQPPNVKKMVYPQDLPLYSQILYSCIIICWI